jgi:ParB family transcriptional regulator, chromosome partitioning protein
MADYLKNWQQAQAARLTHLQFQLTPAQLEIVEKALTQLLPLAKTAPGDSPNARGTALFLLCQTYLEYKEQSL